MKFKQVMGTFYLLLFIGVMGYKLNHFFSKVEGGFLMMGIVITITLMILMIVRKIIYDN